MKTKTFKNILLITLTIQLIFGIAYFAYYSYLMYSIGKDLNTLSDAFVKPGWYILIVLAIVNILLFFIPLICKITKFKENKRLFGYMLSVNAIVFIAYGVFMVYSLLLYAKDMANF